MPQERKERIITKKRKYMEYDWWMALPVEVRKAMVKKRMETAEKMQGSITCEKYGVYMTP